VTKSGVLAILRHLFALALGILSAMAILQQHRNPIPDVPTTPEVLL
jgi:hypothetical protein